MDRTTPPTRGEILPGTLELLVLKTLSAQSMHGYGIAQHIERLSADVFRVEVGSLYPALQRMEAKGWITSKWSKTPTNRRARYYEITRRGAKQLEAEISAFDRVIAAIQGVLRPAT